jgi:hypothetical protein
MPPSLPTGPERAQPRARPGRQQVTVTVTAVFALA